MMQKKEQLTVVNFTDESESVKVINLNIFLKHAIGHFFIGDFPAIDFEKKLYSEAMAILEEHINPKPILPGVVLEQVA